jgi:putative NADH-flavin reductase
MRLAVFGAAGRTGREVVRLAAEAGHDVTAVVRSRAGAGAWPATVTTAEADVHDAAAVKSAVQGADAVVSTLGGRPRQPTTVYSAGAAHLGEALRAIGRTRLICLSAGALDLGPHVPLGQRVVTRAIVAVFFRHGYADMARMEADLATSPDLDWTVVRVPGLTDKPATGQFRAADPPLPRPSSIARADLAAYLLSIVDDPATFRRVLEISY